MKISLFSVSIFFFAATIVAVSSPENTPSSFAQVKTAQGILAGVREGGVWSFKGIPYAQAPVGDLRWREPQAPKEWTGVRRADRFGPRPMQPTLWSDMIFRSTTMSEDCLYLNIWTGAASPEDRRPVLVYFHGGGLVAGDGSEPRYDGTNTAKKGIVVVTINYRLGIFGFFSHPELTSESPHHASGNYGFLDQNAALRWVRDNIAAFGGDPRHVTIGGQSAGASSTCAQMASPLSRGLFVAAIGESGSTLGSNNLTLAEADQAGVKFAEAVGADSLAALRRLTGEQLLEVSQKKQFARGVTIDGYFLPDSPLEIYFTGRQADVPLLAGWNSAEVGYGDVLEKTPPTVENFQRALIRLYGRKADAMAKLYPASTPAEVAQAATDLAGDRFCGYRTWKWIDTHAKSGGKPVYRYLFAQPPPPAKKTGNVDDHAAQPAPLGAPHSSELPYVFGNLDLITGTTWTDADRKTSAAMQDYFANFIKTGNPNGAGLPHWPWLQASIPKIMVIRAESALEPEPNLKRYLLLDLP